MPKLSDEYIKREFVVLFRKMAHEQRLGIIEALTMHDALMAPIPQAQAEQAADTGES